VLSADDIIYTGFDWAALPRGSVVVDVGGGIGSTSMLLASAYAEVDADGAWFFPDSIFLFPCLAPHMSITHVHLHVSFQVRTLTDFAGSGGLRFVIQDRPVVVEMGEKVRTCVSSRL
jgi:hypothetical protein